jgi:DNA polymerase-3 subunit alpha (Gram-positive type)
MYKFFDVFTTLKLPDNLRTYFEDVEIIKVTKTSTNSLARIYIKSTRIIDKEIIYKVEDALKRQIFRIQNMNVRVIERYKLSSQYNPVNIMDMYYPSILFELEKYWTLEFNILKNSTWEFLSGDCLKLYIEDSFLARAHGEDLVSYFKQIFLNRFGFEICRGRDE